MVSAWDNSRRATLFAATILAGCARAVSDEGDPSASVDAASDAASDGAIHDGSYGGVDSATDTSGGGHEDPDTSVGPQPDTSVPPASACTGKSRVMTMSDPFIFDFESGSLGGWYDYGANGALNALTIGSPGALGTQHAGHLAASGLSSFGGGMGFGTGCWDTSALDGISFWAKGTAGADNKVQFQVAIPATHAVANGGDCTAKCFDHPSKQLVLTADWQQYVVAFSDLAQAGFGAPAHYSGVIMALNWVSVDANAVDFDVDEIALYKGAPLSGPVHGSSSAPVDASASGAQ